MHSQIMVVNVVLTIAEKMLQRLQRLQILQRLQRLLTLTLVRGKRRWIINLAKFTTTTR